MSLRVKTLVVAVALVCASIGAASAPAGAVTYRVTMKLSSTTIDLGSSIHVDGTVSPAAPGQLVTLQQNVSGKWQKVTSVHLSSKSFYALIVRPGAPGAHTYRAVWVYTASPSSTLSVYRWHFLSDLPQVDADPCGVGAHSDDINGITYVHSISMNFFCDSTYFAEWDLKRACSQITAVTGLRDDSSSDGQADLEISADSVSLFAHIFNLGATVHPTLNVAGYLRLRLQATSLAGNPVAAYGNARVLCRW